MSDTSFQNFKFSVPLKTGSCSDDNQYRAEANRGTIVQQFERLLSDAHNIPVTAFAAGTADPIDPDELIASWGGVTLERDEVKWSPSDGVPSAIADHLKASIKQLNMFISSGVLIIDSNSTIRPK